MCRLWRSATAKAADRAAVTLKACARRGPPRGCAGAVGTNASIAPTPARRASQDRVSASAPLEDVFRRHGRGWPGARKSAALRGRSDRYGLRRDLLAAGCSFLDPIAVGGSPDL